MCMLAESMLFLIKEKKSSRELGISSFVLFLGGLNGILNNFKILFIRKKGKDICQTTSSVCQLPPDYSLLPNRYLCSSGWPYASENIYISSRKCSNQLKLFRMIHSSHQ